ncbi:chaplin [Streptomyces sp. NPDC091406]|uniref:chaplin n=1 Tax=unclassified Streptomyces TaxID=2593676 RepID=UPI003801C45F
MSRMTKVAAVMAGTGALIAGGAGMASADAGAQGLAAGSPGVGSGNAVQVPVHVPVNVCGNTINVIGLLNPTFGNTCANVSEGHDDNGGDYGYGR